MRDPMQFTLEKLGPRGRTKLSGDTGDNSWQQNDYWKKTLKT